MKQFLSDEERRLMDSACHQCKQKRTEEVLAIVDDVKSYLKDNYDWPLPYYLGIDDFYDTIKTRIKALDK